MMNFDLRCSHFERVHNDLRVWKGYLCQMYLSSNTRQTNYPVQILFVEAHDHIFDQDNEIGADEMDPKNVLEIYIMLLQSDVVAQTRIYFLGVFLFVHAKRLHNVT